MANAQFGNTIFLDTQYAVSSDEIACQNLKVVGIIFCPTASTGSRLKLTDSTNAKIDLRGDANGRTSHINLSDSPIVFSSSIRPTALTSCTATLIVQQTKA